MSKATFNPYNVLKETEDEKLLHQAMQALIITFPVHWFETEDEMKASVPYQALEALCNRLDKGMPIITLVPVPKPVKNKVAEREPELTMVREIKHTFIELCAETYTIAAETSTEAKVHRVFPNNHAQLVKLLTASSSHVETAINTGLTVISDFTLKDGVLRVQMSDPKEPTMRFMGIDVPLEDVLNNPVQLEAKPWHRVEGIGGDANER